MFARRTASVSMSSATENITNLFIILNNRWVTALDFQIKSFDHTLSVKKTNYLQVIVLKSNVYCWLSVARIWFPTITTLNHNHDEKIQRKSVHEMFL